MDADSRLVPHPDAVLRRVGGGAVLVHLGSGHVFELNTTAARAWELACEGLTKAGVIDRLTSEYSGPSDAIAADVSALFKLLAARGLLEA